MFEPTLCGRFGRITFGNRELSGGLDGNGLGVDIFLSILPPVAAFFSSALRLLSLRTDVRRFTPCMTETVGATVPADESRRTTSSGRATGGTMFSGVAVEGATHTNGATEGVKLTGGATEEAMLTGAETRGATLTDSVIRGAMTTGGATSGTTSIWRVSARTLFSGALTARTMFTGATT